MTEYPIAVGVCRCTGDFDLRRNDRDHEDDHRQVSRPVSPLVRSVGPCGLSSASSVQRSAVGQTRAIAALMTRFHGDDFTVGDGATLRRGAAIQLTCERGLQHVEGRELAAHVADRDVGVGITEPVLTAKTLGAVRIRVGAEAVTEPWHRAVAEVAERAWHRGFAEPSEHPVGRRSA